MLSGGTAVLAAGIYPYSSRCEGANSTLALTQVILASSISVYHEPTLATMHRSNTTELITFTLPFPDAVTFTFLVPSPSSPVTSRNAIRITIPPDSKWRMPLHWHPSEHYSDTVSNFGCEQINWISGFIVIYVGSRNGSNYHKAGQGGMKTKISPDDQVGWGRDRSRENGAEFPLEAELVASHALWRNMCGAIRDRAIFPRLASTPWWLKVLFAILAALAPSWRERLLDLMLWIQLQAIFVAHDTYLYHGRIPFTWPWLMTWSRPPDWAKSWQAKSFYVIAWVVMAVIYWAGTLLLGMKGEYVEYTPGKDRGKKNI